MNLMPAQVPPAAQVAFASVNAGEKASCAKSKAAPGEERFSVFRFHQRTFAWEGGRYAIRLEDYPVVRIDPVTARLKVDDWDIVLNFGDAPQLPRMIVRQFVKLWDKAQSGTLSEGEGDSWLKIVDQVDFQAFAEQHALPRYVEGQLVANADVPRVQWHDGSVGFIPRHLGSSLDILEVGEFFSAWVKFSRDGVPQSIERVVPLQLSHDVAQPVS